jgi:hypothetical protein
VRGPSPTAAERFVGVVDRVVKVGVECRHGRGVEVASCSDDSMHCRAFLVGRVFGVQGCIGVRDSRGGFVS